MEVVGFRKKGEKNDAFVKFKDNLVVLDKILDFQRSPCDKKEKEKSKEDTWFSKTPEAGPSTFKFSPHAPAHDNKEFFSSIMQQGVRSIPQRKPRKEKTLI